MLKAIRDNIFVKLDDAPENSSLLISLTDINPVTGVVVDCGPGVYTDSGTFIDMIVEVGDRVLFTNNATNNPIEHDGEKLYAMKPEHIYGIIK